MRIKWIILSCFLSTTVLANVDSLAQVHVDEGKQLFKVHCKACHALDTRLVGPPLKGVTERRDSAWIYAFVKGSQQMIADGDPTAVSLFSEYNQVIMPNQTVSEAEIDKILSYVHDATLPKGAGEEYITRPEVVKMSVLPLQFGYWGFWIPFTIGVIILVGALYYMAELFSLREEKWEDQ